MSTYLTPEELEAIQVLHKRVPYLIGGVTGGMFSIARYYGGIVYKDCPYTYLPEYDELVRDDVLKMVTKMRKAGQTKALQALADSSQELGLF